MSCHVEEMTVYGNFWFKATKWAMCWRPPHLHLPMGSRLTTVAELTTPSDGPPRPPQAAFFPWSPQHRSECFHHSRSHSCRNLGWALIPVFPYWPCFSIWSISESRLLCHVCRIQNPSISSSPLPLSSPSCALSGTPGLLFLFLLVPHTISIPHNTRSYLFKT